MSGNNITNYSKAVPVGSPTTLISNPPRQLYQRIINVGPPTGGVAWLSRVGTPSVNGAGSFPLAPYGNALGLPSAEEFNMTLVPESAFPSMPQGTTLMAISDGGQSGTAPAVLTIEVI